jgi:hypothetical protein
MERLVAPARRAIQVDQAKADVGALAFDGRRNTGLL